MFGMSMGEILVILVIALLFLGPDKLPDAAKAISKGIRDFRKQTRDLQETIEDDEQIGGALRDLRSALRGEEPRPPPPPLGTRPPTPAVGAGPPTAALPETGDDPAADAAGDAQADADPDLPAVRPPVGAVARPSTTAPASPAVAAGDDPDGDGDAAGDPSAGEPPGKAHG